MAQAIQKVLGTARLPQIIGIIIVIGVGVADVTLDPLRIIDRTNPVAHDLVVGAPHDGLQHRKADWPRQPTMAQTETSTPGTIDSLEETLRSPRR